MSFTYHFRSGVKWSDGQPFTAADAAWTLNYYKTNVPHHSADPLDDRRLPLTTRRWSAQDTSPTSFYSGERPRRRGNVSPGGIAGLRDGAKLHMQIVEIQRHKTPGDRRGGCRGRRDDRGESSAPRKPASLQPPVWGAGAFHRKTIYFLRLAAVEQAEVLLSGDQLPGGPSHPAPLPGPSPGWSRCESETAGRTRSYALRAAPPVAELGRPDHEPPKASSLTDAPDNRHDYRIVPIAQGRLPEIRHVVE